MAFMCVVSLGAADAARAAMGDTPSMKTGAETLQPVGHYRFCQQYASECAIRSDDITAADVTPRGWRVIEAVNADVNVRIQAETDQQQYGRDEVWAYPQGAGDCEDYVLEKRRELVAKGFPVGDLLITIVRQPDGSGHAVLTVRTTKGDYVLDNLDERVRVWTKTPYHYLKRQAAYDSGRWVTVENCNEDMLVSGIRK